MGMVDVSSRSAAAYALSAAAGLPGIKSRPPSAVHAAAPQPSPKLGTVPKSQTS